MAARILAARGISLPRRRCIPLATSSHAVRSLASSSAHSGGERGDATIAILLASVAVAATVVSQGKVGGAPVPDASSIERHCSCEGWLANFRRQDTMIRLERTSSRATLKSRYRVDWDTPLGEGGYGAVYLCTDRETGARRALKMIPKKYTNEESFQAEIDALLRVREKGGHPNICRLKEVFDQSGNFYLVMDLISGGELFDHLAANGAYSEADAARLVMETASALAFLHGVGLVHADLKPENLLLSTPNKDDAVIKLVDFGCSESYKGDVDAIRVRANTSTTAAYSPPEAFGRHKGPLSPSFDMWSLGCILFIMLTGTHPFDLDGTSTDEEMVERIKKGVPPLRNAEATAHLSDSAIDLIEKLMNKRPRRRLTAMQMLEHPWVKGETASTEKIEHSDEKLGAFRNQLEVNVFSDWISEATSDAAKKTSLMERAFAVLHQTISEKGEKSFDESGANAANLSMSGLSALLSENMVNKHFSEGHTVYKEGAKGDFIYFISSGKVEVSTKAGFKTTLSQGQMFGEGALLGDNLRRSATIKCLTPVHVIRISKEYFEKYVKGGGSELNLTLRVQDRARSLERALTMLRLQKNLLQRDLLKDDVLFTCGEDGKSIYIVDEGEIKIIGDTGKHILNVGAGEVCGEHSLVTGLPRNTTAVCASNQCKVYEITAKDFAALNKSMKQSMERVCFRRDFQKAIAKKFGQDFDNSMVNLRKAFDEADLDKSGALTLEEVKVLLGSLYPSVQDNDSLAVQALQTLDIDGDNSVTWEEFKKVFSQK